MDVFALFLLNNVSRGIDLKFLLGQLPVSRYAQIVDKRDVTSVCKFNRFLLWERVTHLSEVDYLFVKGECGGYDVSAEQDRQEFCGAFESESEGFLEFSWNWGRESDVDGRFCTHAKRSFFDIELEHFAEVSFVRKQLELAIYFSLVINMNFLDDFLVHKTVSQIDFTLR